MMMFYDLLKGKMYDNVRIHLKDLKEYLEDQVLMWLQGAKWPSYEGYEDHEVESEDWG